jgi:hypothetical protein
MLQEYTGNISPMPLHIPSLEKKSRKYVHKQRIENDKIYLRYPNAKSNTPSRKYTKLKPYKQSGELDEDYSESSITMTSG